MKAWEGGSRDKGLAVKTLSYLAKEFRLHPGLGSDVNFKPGNDTVGFSL